MARRKTMNVSLSPDLKAWVDRQVKRGDFGTASEFIRHVLRSEREAMTHQQIERALLDVGGRPQELTPARWAEIERKARERVAQLKGQRRRSA